MSIGAFLIAPSGLLKAKEAAKETEDESEEDTTESKVTIPIGPVKPIPDKSAKERPGTEKSGGENPVASTDPNAEKEKESPPFFFDARSSGFTKDGSQQILDGDVIAIGPQSLVTADKVVIDQQSHYLVAEGHVIILTAGQYITGDKIQIWADTGDIKVTSALLVINDSSETDRIANEILGFSSSEIEFEAHRGLRKSELGKKKDVLRTEARQRAKEGLSVPENVVHEYATFLEQEDMISNQENPAFAQMSEVRRKTLRRRRDFWDQARLADRVKGTPTAAAYFRMTGETLERTNGNDFRSTDGLWTPCHCDKDEQPAWSIRSSETFAQPGGYATFSNAVLEIKGLPVLYMPWLRIPIKDKRQSGLLPPTMSSDQASGSVYSQPLYLDLGPDKDATIKADVFERRGTRVGGEYRYQAKQYSGFQLNGEIMQDRLWSQRRANREDLRNLYLSGLDAANDPIQGQGQDDDLKNAGYTGREYTRMRLRQRSFWDTPGDDSRPYPFRDCVNTADPVKQLACRNSLSTQLRPPENERRGSFRWHGQERLTDRLSFISTGEYYSDRQYNTDLYVPESFQAGFDTGTGEKALQPIRNQLHYDGREYYLGLGSALGDYVLRNDHYEGYQLPAIIKAKTRWYRLGNTGNPIYGNISTDQLRIVRNVGNKADPEAGEVYLPNAWWRRASVSLIAPISSKSAVQVDHFTDLEARSIAFDSVPMTFDKPRRSDLNSTIQSLRTGFRFQLPIDGKSPLPDWLGGSDIKDEDGTRYIQHIMNWSMTLTARPNVVRRGVYGELDGPLAPEKPTDPRKAFMATDLRGGEESIPAEDFMDPYQLVTFQTNHRWKIFSELWKRIDGEKKEPDDVTGAKTTKALPPKTLTYEERARRELLYTMDHPVRSDGEMFSEDQTKWFINRYQLLDTDYLEPVTFSSTISYDRLKEVRRRNGEDPIANRPWTEPSASLGISALGWSFSASSQYNIYDRVATKHSFGLSPPGFFDTNVKLGYTLSQVGQNVKVAGSVVNEERVEYHEEREKTLELVSSLTKPVMTTYSWARKENKKEGAVPNDYQQKIGLVYASPTNCWGLGFSREKTYGNDEGNATYMLQLNIIFMGQGRDLPDLGNQVTREIKKS